MKHAEKIFVGKTLKEMLEQDKKDERYYYCQNI